MLKEIIPKKSIRRCLGATLSIGFALAIFAGAMGAYAGIEGISYGQAWTNLGNALHALFTLIGDAINKAGK